MFVASRTRLELAAEEIFRKIATDISFAIRDSVASAIAPPTRSPTRSGPLMPLRVAVARVEREHIQRALDQNGGSVIRAARALDVPVTTLKYKLSKYRLR